MTYPLINAAPMVIDLGIRDLSTVPVDIGSDSLPQHLPKFYHWAKKGDGLPHILTAAQRNLLYGTASFDYLGKYANHVTPWIVEGQALGNMMVLQRVIPEDAKTGSLTIWLDVLPTQVDDYERNTDGSIKLDPAGDPIVIGQIQGYRVKFVKTFYPDATAMQAFGTLDPVQGDQIDVATGTRSMRYPLFELKATSAGEYANNTGIRFWAPTNENNVMPTKLMEQMKCYPYYVSVIERQEGLSTPKVVRTIFNEPRKMVTLKPEVYDPLTTARTYFGEVFLDAYQNIEDIRYPLQFSDFGSLRVYQANIELLVAMFHTAEIPYIRSSTDFSSDAADSHLFNFIGGCDSSGNQYHSYVFTTAPNAIRLTEFTNVFGEGGSDGTMSDANFNAFVKADLSRYLDDYDPLAGDMVAHPETHFWDSGFPLDVKRAAPAFMSVRKDTFVSLSTFDATDRVLAESEEFSLGIALRTALRNYPESDYFGTSACRGKVTSGSAFILNSLWKKRVPMEFDFFLKVCSYAGAAEGKWIQGRSPNGEPGHIINSVTRPSIPWIPKPVRNRFWDVGLNWIDRYDQRRYFWPAYKTVYDNDTSVLNSFFVVLACQTCNRISHRIWRELCGRDDLSNEEIIKEANRRFAAKVKDLFDNRYVVIPDAEVTEHDAALGFVWRMKVKLYANNMKTVEYAYLEAYRMSDLVAQ